MNVYRPSGRAHPVFVAAAAAAAAVALILSRRWRPDNGGLAAAKPAASSCSCSDGRTKPVSNWRPACRTKRMSFERRSWTG